MGHIAPARQEDLFLNAAIAQGIRGTTIQNLGNGSFPITKETPTQEVTQTNAESFTIPGTTTATLAAAINTPTLEIMTFLMDGIATVEEKAGTQVAAGETELLTQNLAAEDLIPFQTRFTGNTHPITQVQTFTNTAATGTATTVNPDNYSIVRTGGQYNILFKTLATTVRAVRLTFGAFTPPSGYRMSVPASSSRGTPFELKLYWEERRGNTFDTMTYTFPNAVVIGDPSTTDGGATTPLIHTFSIQMTAPSNGGSLYTLDRDVDIASTLETVDATY